MEGQLEPIPSNKQNYCEHMFFNLSAPKGFDAELKEGANVWFYCDKCLLIIKKKLIDQSDQL